MNDRLSAASQYQITRPAFTMMLHMRQKTPLGDWSIPAPRTMFMASALRITRCVGRNARFSKKNSKNRNLLKTCDEAMAPTRSVIEGLSWRKLSADALQFSHSHLRKARKWGKTRKSSEAEDCPLTERRMNTPQTSERPPKKASSVAASPCGKRVMRKATTLTRMKSVLVKQKEALNTLKQVKDQVSFKAHFWNDTRIVQFWYTRTAHDDFLVTSSRTYQNCMVQFWNTRTGGSPRTSQNSVLVFQNCTILVYSSIIICVQKKWISININDISI